MTESRFGIRSAADANQNRQRKVTAPPRPTPDFSGYMESGVRANAGRTAGRVKGSPRPRGKTAPLKTAGRNKNASVPKRIYDYYRTLPKFDFVFFTMVMVLVSCGLIVMYSASYATAYSMYGDSNYYLIKQLRFAALGFALMIVFSAIPYDVFINPFVLRIEMIVAAGLMVAVKVMGVTQGGAERWIEIAGITFQPSELLKFVVIALFASLAKNRYDKRNEFWRGFSPYIICLGVACGLTLIQPHLSGTIIIFLIGTFMMFIAECRLKFLIPSLLAIVAAGALVLLFMNSVLHIDYFGARIQSFLDPESDITNKTYQTYQSLVTIGSGGLWGLGFGNSRQKFSFLPASQNDFVFPIICEELGFAAGLVVIIMFVVFVWRGCHIAARSRDRAGMMIAVGISFQIGLQALLNIAVVTNSFFNTGVSLPFFSYGGTALVMQMIEVGIILNISRKAALE